MRSGKHGHEAKRVISYRRVGTPESLRREIPILLLSVFMVSFALLAFEISLIRMFSVMFAYHYAFLAISIAFAGLGLGGILAYLVFPEATSKEVLAGLAIACSLFSVLSSLFTIAAASSRFPDVFATSLLYFLSFLPSGIFLATVYKFFAEISNLIYGADIIGASVGSISVVTLLNRINPIITILMLCGILSVISISLALFSSKKTVLSITIIFLLITASLQIFAARSAIDVPIGSAQGKELFELSKNQASDVRIVESRWSAFGRTDLVELKNNPYSMIIFIDGGAGTEMYRFNGSFTDSETPAYKLRFSTAAYPFYLINNRENVLIIGPGGGKDVLITLMFNFSHIYAVEINQDTVNIVKDYSSFNGGIYTDYDNVHIYVDEGRSFLRRSAMNYDAIMLNIPITKTTQGTTGYSMAENYLFTTDSFKDYLNHLRDDGYLIIVAHHRFELYKLITTAVKVLENEGKNVKEAMKHMVSAEGKGHHATFPVLILKKTPFNSTEAKKLLEKSVELNLQPVYFPYTNSSIQQILDPALVALTEGKIDLVTLITKASQLKVDISPPTDDRPFFYKFEMDLPSTLPLLLIGFSAMAAIFTFAYLLMWGQRFMRARSPRTRWIMSEKFSIFMPYYFASLGLGFMLTEVAFAQKFVLFLGQPTLAISTILFSLLLSMGIGGFLSKKWKESTELLWKASMLIGIIVISYIFILPLIFDTYLDFNLNTRLIISFVLSFPIGFLLGIPFPTGIKIMSQLFESSDVTWMWGLNSLYSLLGSTLAVVIAMLFGYSIALLLGGVVYLTIFGIGWAWSKGRGGVQKYESAR